MSMTSRVPAVAAGAGTLVGCAAWLAGFGDAASAIWAATTLLLLVPLTWSVVKTLARGDVGVDAIALLAMGGALAVGEYLAGAVIAVMLAGGNALEEYAQGRAGRELSALVSKIPTTARVRRGGDVVTVPVDRLDPGDRMVVNTGDTVAADARLVSAHAVFDTSSLTGEPLPVDVAAGAQVASGSVNAGPPVELDAIRRAGESTYAAIVRLVESAQGSKAPFVRMADRYAVWFLGLTVMLAVGAWAGVRRPGARGRRARGRHPVPADPGCARRTRVRRLPGGQGRSHREGGRGDRTAGGGAHRPARQDRDADAGHAGGRRGASAADFRQRPASGRRGVAGPGIQPRRRKGPGERSRAPRDAAAVPVGRRRVPGAGDPWTGERLDCRGGQPHVPPRTRHRRPTRRAEHRSSRGAGCDRRSLRRYDQRHRPLETRRRQPGRSAPRKRDPRRRAGHRRPGRGRACDRGSGRNRAGATPSCPPSRRCS